ncbi:uncharacterized protein LOC116122188 [Pistacia vera]|uniref:uncharacterized protein LOC116122188 n=1 Tax=Pistacia vera TaxID=55513 RepID=UPI001262B6E3|nr:uncharacterized protein LOC116122188 [Pistacia vera]
MGKKMACQAIEAWTISELVGAYLDLSIAYLLLCGSTLAYIMSKFLGLFGLSLPCPCHGLFGNPSKINYNNCLQSLLVDCPPEKISNVQFLVKTKFPFDSVFANNLNPQLKIERNFEGEASCRSFSREVIEGESPVEEGSFDVKGKAITSRSLSSGIKHRENASADNDKSPSVSSLDPLLSDEQAVLGSPASHVKQNAVTHLHFHLLFLHILMLFYVDGFIILDEKGDFKEEIGMLNELNEPLDENKVNEKDVLLVQEFNYNLQGQLEFDGLDKDAIRILEQALEEQLAARSTLYLELEKERSAAATAADEAMAMILRLQEEKASIEMEAWQYQRMIEEKYAYDAEEMNILKEILVRRERERHFLEKEVEAFRQMFFANEQLEADMEDTASTLECKASSSLYFNEDPAMMLLRISKSFGEKKKIKGTNDVPENDVTSTESQNYTLPLGKELPIPELVEDTDSSKLGYIHGHPSFNKRYQQPSRNSDEIFQDLQEKGIMSMDKNPIDLQREVQADDNSSSQGLTSKTIETCGAANIGSPCSASNVEKHKKLSQSLVKTERDLCVNHVPVIGNELVMFNETRGNKSEDLSNNVTVDIPISCDSTTINSSETATDIKRSKSDISSSRLLHMGSQQSKDVLSNLRRNSMSALDYERLKIDNEVGWLTERLRVVQEGREKLNFSIGRRDREKVQLQLLEDITSQLQEIRQLTEPGKALRDASLPPLSAKVILKKKAKRRTQSVSLGEQRSA